MISTGRSRVSLVTLQFSLSIKRHLHSKKYQNAFQERNLNRKILSFYWNYYSTEKKLKKNYEDKGKRIPITSRKKNVIVSASKVLELKLEQDIVLRHSHACLSKEQRADKVEATIWSADSQYPPIMTLPGQRSVVQHTDDLPEHATPVMWWRPMQSRQFFAYQRDYNKKILRFAFLVFSLFAAVGIGLGIEIFVHQPRDLVVLREELLQQAYGKVLELGAGQGASIGLYPYPVHEIWMMDKDLTMLKRLFQRLPTNSYPSYNILHKKVEDLQTVPSNSFDTIVDCFGLCHYEDPTQVVQEMQRICKPNGVILLLEHGKTQRKYLNCFLEWYRGSNPAKTHGCVWNRDVEGFIKHSGMVVKEFRRKHFGTTIFTMGYPQASQ